jgi:hypothetical protein
MEIKNIYDAAIFVSSALTIKDALIEAINAKTDLRCAYLRGADLSGAYLRGADLRSAYLSGAYLSGADLSGANLRGAYLRGAYLRDSDLSGANLSGAYLRDSDLSGAYLRGAYLSGADLRGAYLRGADLRCAYLRGAYLSGADLSGKKIHSLRSFSSCIYPYEVWAVLYEDGSRSVRMGCLFKSLKEWENYPILKSNVGEFPDDGSDASLDRAAMFELAKAAALRMTVPEK